MAWQEQEISRIAHTLSHLHTVVGVRLEAVQHRTEGGRDLRLAAGRPLDLQAGRLVQHLVALHDAVQAIARRLQPADLHILGAERHAGDLLRCGAGHVLQCVRDHRLTGRTVALRVERLHGDRVCGVLGQPDQPEVGETVAAGAAGQADARVVVVEAERGSSRSSRRSSGDHHDGSAADGGRNGLEAAGGGREQGGRNVGGADGTCGLRTSLDGLMD